MQGAGGDAVTHGVDRTNEADCIPGPEGAVAIAAEAKALREANVAFLKRARRYASVITKCVPAPSGLASILPASGPVLGPRKRFASSPQLVGPGGSHRKREMSERAMSEAGKLDQRLPESAARQPSSRSHDRLARNRWPPPSPRHVPQPSPFQHALVQSQGRSGSWPRSGAADPLNNLRSVRSEMALSDSVYEPRQAHPTAALQSVEQESMFGRFPTSTVPAQLDGNRRLSITSEGDERVRSCLLGRQQGLHGMGRASIGGDVRPPPRVTSMPQRMMDHQLFPPTAEEWTHSFHSRSCGDSEPLPGESVAHEVCARTSSGSPCRLRLPPATPQGLVPGQVWERHLASHGGQCPSPLAAAAGSLPKLLGTPPLDLDSAELVLDMRLNFDEHDISNLTAEDMDLDELLAGLYAPLIDDETASEQS